MFCFFFNDTATTEIYTLSLHDALPISEGREGIVRAPGLEEPDHGLFRRDFQVGHHALPRCRVGVREVEDRKSTRLNSSHANISYAVFCLKKKKKIHLINPILSTLTYYL